MLKFKILLVLVLCLPIKNYAYEFPEIVSIFSLIQNPDMFYNKKIRIISYLHKTGEYNYSLYPYKEDAHIEDPKRTIIIDNYKNPIDFSKCTEKYVAIVGFLKKGVGENNILMFYNIQSINLNYDIDESSDHPKPTYNNTCYWEGDKGQ